MGLIDRTPLEWLQQARTPHLANAVHLEPLVQGHADDLALAGASPTIWAHLGGAPFGPTGSAAKWIEAVLLGDQAGRSASFAQIDPATDRAVGSTRFMNPDFQQRRVEIGFTWLAPSHQRTPMNTAAKLLLLDFAFGVLGAQVVELKTDLCNTKSQRAIRRLGAKRTKLIYRHQLTPTFMRDTVYFEIVKSDWPGLRATLAKGLG